MPPYVIIAIAVSAAGLALLSWVLVVGPDRQRRRTLANLDLGPTAAAAEPSEADAEGGTRGLAGVAGRMLPPTMVQRLDRMLGRAGRPAGLPLERLLAAKLALPSVAAVLGMIYLRSAPSAVSIMTFAAVLLVLFFLPELMLHSRAQKRSEQIGLELPDTLDQMMIAVEAGLGFDQAMQRAAGNGKGPLAEELVRTLQDMSVGRSRRGAYTDLAERTGAPDLRRFIRAVIQADKYGVAVADTLRTQAAEMRLKRRQRAEEKAMQIPVKVIFPLMLCILPVLFIVLMGPAAMDIMAAFSG